MPTALRTKRLRLVPVAVGDEDAICALLWQPEVRRYLCDDTLIPRETVQAWIADHCDPSSDTTLWHILRSGTSEGQQNGDAVNARDRIGLVGLRAPMADATRLRAIGWRSLEVIIALDPVHWGQGFAADAIAAVADEARNSTVYSLLGLVDLPNERSHRLMQRCGFQELGRIAGPAHPLIVHELLL